MIVVEIQANHHLLCKSNSTTKRNVGLAASQTTFCILYIDNGNGPQYFGVYTLVEEVDDSVLESQFGDESAILHENLVRNC